MRLQVADQSAPFDPVTTGNALRRAIRVADVAQEVVAIKVGISSSQLSRLLRARRPLTAEMAERIRAAITELAPDEEVA